MKVLVTGAGGLIGRAIVGALTRAGHSPSATDRPGVDLRYANAPSESFELRDVERLAAFARGHEAIVHSAGLFDLGAPLQALRDANVDVVKAVVEGAQRAGVKRLVHLSTVGVYGTPRTLPCPESERPRPRQNYERTKRDGEEVARSASSLDVTVLRPTLVYGPYSRYGFSLFMGWLYLTLSSGKTAMRLPRGSPRLHGVHSEDVARAAVFCLEHQETTGKTFNVADDAPLPMHLVFGGLAKELGIEPRYDIPFMPRLYRLLIWVVGQLISDATLARSNARMEQRWKRLSAELSFTPGFLPKMDRDWFCYFGSDHVYDNSRLKALGFEYSHPNVAQGLSETLHWYQQNNWLPPAAPVLAWGLSRKQKPALPAGNAPTPHA